MDRQHDGWKHVGVLLWPCLEGVYSSGTSLYVALLWTDSCSFLRKNVENKGGFVWQHRKPIQGFENVQNRSKNMGILRKSIGKKRSKILRIIGDFVWKPIQNFTDPQKHASFHSNGSVFWCFIDVFWYRSWWFRKDVRAGHTKVFVEKLSVCYR